MQLFYACSGCRREARHIYDDHVSGDDSGACYDDGNILGGLDMSKVFVNHTVCGGYPARVTAAVKSKLPNARGLFDKSGNV